MFQPRSVSDLCVPSMTLTTPVPYKLTEFPANGRLLRFRNWFMALVIADTKEENINMPDRIIPYDAPPNSTKGIARGPAQGARTKTSVPDLEFQGRAVLWK